MKENPRIVQIHLRLKKSFLCLTCLSLLFSASPSMAAADDFKKAQQQHSKTINSEIKSQQNIDQMDDAIQNLEREIKIHQQKIKTLNKYNQRMEKLITHQVNELTELKDETKRVTHLDREMLPLVEDMLDNLDAFIARDLPFLPVERSQRINHLSKMLDRADVSVAEKFRRMLEAYQIESEFGRTLEVYQGQLPETQRVVDFLRIGRNMLFYKSQNNKEIARWDTEQQAWHKLDKKYYREIKKAYLIAKNQRAPELLLLPVPKAALYGEKAQ